MKRFITVMVLITVLLVACSSSDQGTLSSKDVVKNIEEHKDQVSDFTVHIDLDINQKMQGQEQNAKILLEGAIALDNNQKLESLLTSLEQKVDNQGQKIESYYHDKKGYVNLNDTGWVETTAPMKIDSTYYPTLESFLKVADQMEMSTEENEYVFSYSGKAEGLFNEIKDVFSLTLTSIPMDKVTLNLKYTFNKEDYTLTSVLYDVVFDTEQISGNMKASGQYSKINQTKIEKPEAIK